MLYVLWKEACHTDSITRHITHAHVHMLDADNYTDKHSKRFPAHDELEGCRTSLV